VRIGILGSGLMGGKLGTLFARAGHDVVFSYARSQAKLKRLARIAGDNALAGTPAEAAQGADALLLAGLDSPMCCNRQAIFPARSSSAARCRWMPAIPSSWSRVRRRGWRSLQRSSRRRESWLHQQRAQRGPF
jgi:hypothetical protein